MMIYTAIGNSGDSYIVFEDAAAFSELFCIAFVTLDGVWAARRATRADFAAVMGN